jgi:BirA family biotin operon repressor/biotin-[acetyl-CoA-carboxylase] ligase
MRIRFVERTGSTNADLLADSSAREGDWLVALAQDAGRGRQGREWRSLLGNFFGSTVVDLRPTDHPPTTLSLAAGLALIRAVEVAAPAGGLVLKWPNDLLMDDAKLGGVLLERSGERVVAGFGVNLAAAPDLPDRAAASLASVAHLTPQSFAPLIAASFSRALELWRGDQEQLRTLWLESAHPIGTKLTVHPGRETLTGEFAGLDDQGAMLLRLDDGRTEMIHAADISLS